jgi:hypothetical protein
MQSQASKHILTNRHGISACYERAPLITRWRVRAGALRGARFRHQGSNRAGRCDSALSAGYSPDLNPIEQAFAKLKAALRKAAARTFDTLIEAIADALDTFTPEQCANYIANSGYRRQS